MTKAGKVIGWLLIAFGLLANPIFLTQLFSNDGRITSIGLTITVVMLEFLFVLFGITLIKNQQNRCIENLGIGLVSLLFIITTTVITDRVYGAFFMPEKANLLFPPFSKAKHKTSEFDLTVEINNLGFRGANASTKKTKPRVIIIGDSFTFGWGVELDKTWIHILSNSYPELEILNLGQGGNHPGDYVQVLKRALPVLKPDLVMICILQGNDLHQLMQVLEHESRPKELPTSEPTYETREQKINRILSLIYPHLSQKFSGPNYIQKRWLKDANSILLDLDEHQQNKYNAINQSIRNNFEQGLLNPALIYESIHHPNLFSDAIDTTNRLCQNGVQRLHDHLAEIQALSDGQNATAIYISMPNRPYGFPSELNALTELGFNVSSVDSLDPSLVFTKATQGLKAPVLLPQLKGSNLFFRYDGHWNENGNRIFAHELKTKLDSIPEWKHFLTSSNF